MVRLWEVAEVPRVPGARPGERRRASLHWTRKSATAAARTRPGHAERMRTVPRFMRPVVRFAWW